MVSRARDLADLIKANSSISVPSGNTAQRPTGVPNYFRYNTQTSGFEGFTTDWGAIAGTSNEIGVGMSLYSNVSSFPASANVGQQAFATDTSSVYIWNGTVWYLISTATTPTGAPAITIGPNSSYRLSTDGTPTVITLTAVDPEGSNVIWSYAVTGGSLANTATISQLNNVFTITPSTEANNAGVFVVTFTASDGSNISIARTTIRLSFVLLDYAVGFRLTGQSTVPFISGSQANAQFGRRITAHNGKLAITGLSQHANSFVSVANYTYGVTVAPNTSIYIYETSDYGNPTFLYKIGLPSGVSVWPVIGPGTPVGGYQRGIYWGLGIGGIMLSYNTLISSVNYLIGQYSDGSGAIYYGKSFLVFQKNSANNDWSQTQYMYVPQSTYTYEAYSTVLNESCPMSVSNDGLIMLIGNSSAVSIYRRANTNANTWSHVSTLSSGNIGSSTNASGVASGGSLHFKGAKISNTGKHIALYSNENDTTTPSVTDGGRIIILTNSNPTTNGTSWTKTFDRSPVTGNSTTISVQVSCHEDEEDIFYGLYQRSNSSLSTLEMLKYDNFSGTWTLKQYDSYGGKILSSSISTPGSLNYFSAFPPASGYSNVAFGSIRAESHTGLPSFVVIRGENGDISSTSNTSFVSTANSYWITPHLLPNQAVESIAGQDPSLIQDVTTGEVYVSLPNANYPDANSGIVLKYTPAFANGAVDYIQSYEKIVVGNTASGNVTVVVPYGIRYLHGVCVGAGGTGVTVGPPHQYGGGGALKWVSNYPVNQGDIITLRAGVSQNTPGVYANSNSSIYINGQRIIEAGGGSSNMLGGRALTGVMPVGAITSGGNGGGGSGQYGYGGAGGYNGDGGTYGGAGPTGGAGSSGIYYSTGGGVALYGISNTGDSGGVKDGSVANIPSPYNVTFGYGANIIESNQVGGTGAVRLLLGDSFVFANTAANTSVFVRPIGYLGSE